MLSLTCLTCIFAWDWLALSQVKPCLFLKNAEGTAALGGWPINLCCFVIFFKLQISQMVQRDLALQENLLMPSRSKAELTATVGGAWHGEQRLMPLETGGVCLGHLVLGG